MIYDDTSVGERSQKVILVLARVVRCRMVCNAEGIESLGGEDLKKASAGRQSSSTRFRSEGRRRLVD